MITGHSFICFGEDIGSTRLSRFQIMKRLAAQNQVLYIESIGVRSPRSNLTDLRRIVTKVRRWFRGCWTYADNLHILSPVSIPLLQSRFVRDLNRRLLILQLKYWKRSLNLQHIILWVGLPTAVPIVGKLQEELVVYHCADRLVDYVSPQERPLVNQFHMQMLKKADLVFTPSELLQSELSQFNQRCVHLPHGVDYEHFSSSANSNIQVPNEVQTLPKPVVGFWGTIDNNWIDFKLLTEVALARPNWSLVLIGPVTQCVEIQPLLQLSNVFFLGPRAYEQLPAYAKAFSVCMIPKKITRLTDASSPLKLREYLATGKPVISTLPPSSQIEESLVVTARTPEEWIVGIERILANDTQSLRAARKAAVREATWENRLENVSEVLTNALACKEAQS